MQPALRSHGVRQGKREKIEETEREAEEEMLMLLLLACLRPPFPSARESRAKEMTLERRRSDERKREKEAC